MEILELCSTDPEACRDFDVPSDPDRILQSAKRVQHVCEVAVDEVVCLSLGLQSLGCRWLWQHTKRNTNPLSMLRHHQVVNVLVSHDRLHPSVLLLAYGILEHCQLRLTFVREVSALMDGRIAIAESVSVPLCVIHLCAAAAMSFVSYC